MYSKLDFLCAKVIQQFVNESIKLVFNALLKVIGYKGCICIT